MNSSLVQMEPNESSQCHTTMNLVSCEQFWTIDHFSSCDNRNSNSLVSKKFWPTVNPNLQFYMALYPRDYNEESKGYVSLFLYWTPIEDDEEETPTQLTIGYKFSVVNALGQKCKTIGSRCKFSKTENKGYGYPKFINRDYLVNPINGFLYNDKLVIHCEVSYVTNMVTQFCPGQAFPNQRLAHQSELVLANDFTNFWDSSTGKKYADVLLIVGRKEFHAHKVILAARSPVFAAMFEHDMKEARQNRVKISDVKWEAVEELIRFIYTGKVRNLQEFGTEILVVADKYQLQYLKEICEEVLCSQLTTETAHDFYQLADMHNARKLKAESFEYIQRHTIANIRSIVDRPDLMLRASATMQILAIEKQQPFDYVPPDSVPSTSSQGDVKFNGDKRPLSLHTSMSCGIRNKRKR